MDRPWDEVLHRNYPTGRKICSSPVHCGPRWLPIHSFTIAKRTTAGRPQALHASCSACRRRRRRTKYGLLAREEYDRRRMVHPETGPASAAEIKKRQAEAIRKDPKRLEKQRRYHREYYHLRRRDPSWGPPKRLWRKYMQPTILDAGPLGEWLADFFQRNRDVVEPVEISNGRRTMRPVYSHVGLGKAMGISHSQARDIILCTRPITVTLEQVDLALDYCGATHMLSILYPEDVG